MKNKLAEYLKNKVPGSSDQDIHRAIYFFALNHFQQESDDLYNIVKEYMRHILVFDTQDPVVKKLYNILVDYYYETREIS